jgi:secreted protein with Ig-like and vWFA domain
MQSRLAISTAAKQTVAKQTVANKSLPNKQVTFKSALPFLIDLISELDDGHDNHDG